MENKILNFLKLLIACLLFFYFSDIMFYLFNLLGLNISISNYLDYGYINGLHEALIFVIIFIIYKQEIKEDLDKYKTEKNKITKLIKLFVIFFIVKFISAYLTSILSVIFDINIITSENQKTIVEIMKEAPLIMLITSSVFAPIVEEGVFRLGFSKVFKNNLVFIIISGLAFGLMHVFPTNLPLYIALIEGITYVTMGSFLSYIYVKSNNIWTTIILHAVNNLISCLIIMVLY